MSLPPTPLALAGYAPTQAAHRELEAIVKKYGQQCWDAALEDALPTLAAASCADWEDASPVYRTSREAAYEEANDKLARIHTAREERAKRLGMTTYLSQKSGV